MTASGSIIPSKTGDLTEERPVVMKKEGSMVNLHTRLAARASAALDAHDDPSRHHLSPLPSPTHVKKYVKLKNLLDGKTFVDTLHRSTAQVSLTSPYCYLSDNFSVDVNVEKCRNCIFNCRLTACHL